VGVVTSNSIVVPVNCSLIPLMPVTPTDIQVDSVSVLIVLSGCYCHCVTYLSFSPIDSFLIQRNLKCGLWTLEIIVIDGWIDGWVGGWLAGWPGGLCRIVEEKIAHN